MVPERCMPWNLKSRNETREFEHRVCYADWAEEIEKRASIDSRVE
jgi:diadenosine tetraphosphatase ApaH/serine/threonine PP2A family protein phosphatase